MVCDICGVGLNIWNNWKVMLICLFYGLIWMVLEDGMEVINWMNCGVEVCKVLCKVLVGWDFKVVK